MKKWYIYVIVPVVAAGFFLGGMYYSSSTQSSGISVNGGLDNAGDLRGVVGVEGGGRFTGGLGGNSSSSMVNGEVLSMDDGSITVKNNSGGSDIVFVSSSTKVSENVEMALTDITVGENVMIVGTKNDDGTVTATSIQLGDFGGGMGE